MDVLSRSIIFRENDDLDDYLLLMIREYRRRKNAPSNRHRGSIFGHKVYDRNREEGARKLHRDYFDENPTYPEKIFRRRFRMSSRLFNRIAKAVEEHDHYFVQKKNAAGVRGFSCRQKVTAALRQLAYGVPADYVDEYVRIGESTAIESLRKFVRAIVHLFRNEYLRAPNVDDTTRLLNIAECRGFPCMLSNGEAPEVKYTINGHDYDMGYYLADGIYPTWSTFVKTKKAPTNAKDKNFAKAQEAQRKDVERAFGVLQARFAIVRGPARFWDEATLRDIMVACVIMHNMIIEDERADEHIYESYDSNDADVSMLISRAGTTKFTSFMQMREEIENSHVHCQLQKDLIEHLWEQRGQMDSQE
ncbi:uncharacterized protein [Zea mays]|uniref:uncharacterized protein n=1 Tax=Zea mays TaxID=4577 RepID=UPI0009AA9A50|nr:uncharacterized protein LOC103644669 [Zea mays]|eukprot:XP_020397305.1 uncharacterized protein LOC103644669 [Zea mays]